MVRACGTNSAVFTILSGVPQGCPFSPLDFLVVLEALSRVIKARRTALDPTKRIDGITIAEVEHILSQFADDTLAFLRGYHSLPAFWAIVEEF